MLQSYDSLDLLFGCRSVLWMEQIVSLRNVNIQWNPDFLNLQGERRLVREIGEFEKSGVKLQCLTEERERLLVLAIGRFEKMRVREIGIPL